MKRLFQTTALVALAAGFGAAFISSSGPLPKRSFVLSMDYRV